MKRHFNARSLEWFNAMYLMAWGAWVILFPGLMTESVLKDSFSGLISLAPQQVWGLAAFTGGSIRVIALWVNGQWGLTPLIRVMTSFMSVFIWFWIAVGLVKTGLPQPGIVMYGGLMIADMFSAFRAAGDAYEAEVARRMKSQLESSNVASFSGRR
jgi:hypothetical protein